MLKRLKDMFVQRRGIAAVEFAFVAPVVLVLFFGTVEVTAALDCRARVSNAVSTASDLVAQASAVTTTDLANIYSATKAIIYPFNTNAIILTITSIKDNNSGGTAGNNDPTGTVLWSYTKNGTKRSGTVSVPTGLLTSGSGQSVILAEITYNYSSPSTEFLTHALSMTGTFYSRPRRAATVACTGC
jgi:Flp pilus assembly protein TadG